VPWIQLLRQRLVHKQNLSCSNEVGRAGAHCHLSMRRHLNFAVSVRSGGGLKLNRSSRTRTEKHRLVLERGRKPSTSTYPRLYCQQIFSKLPATKRLTQSYSTKGNVQKTFPETCSIQPSRLGVSCSGVSSNEQIVLRCGEPREHWACLFTERFVGRGDPDFAGTLERLSGAVLRHRLC